MVANSSLKTCRDIQLCNKDIKSGERFIDPNLGCAADKFEVFCNFDNGKSETCIRPRQTVYDGKLDTFNEWKYLIEDLKVHQEISYDADSVALRYMRLNSLTVRQNFTYECFNQHAYRDTNGDIGRHVMIRTADGAEIDTDSKRSKMFLDVIKDECNVKDDTWHAAVFELSSKKLDSLPITDIRFRQSAIASKYRIKLGPVCFS